MRNPLKRKALAVLGLLSLLYGCARSRSLQTSPSPTTIGKIAAVDNGKATQDVNDASTTQPATPPGTPPATPSGRSVVVWISVDGLRHDYVEHFHPPFLTRMQQEGAFTTALVPIFPSITFPSHTAEATGTTVDHHGISANSFYDTDLQKAFQMSDASTLLQSEPIWITAARQHVRVAMGDWPFSYQETGPVTADYFGQRFDNSATDDSRMVRLSQIWADDVNGATTQPAHREPLRLIMGYVADVDHAGHRYGPDARETGEAVNKTDDILSRFQARCVEQFDATMKPEDELYFIVTTDHGMSPVSTLVNLERLLGDTYQPTMRIITSGNLANVYIDQLPPSERESVAHRIVGKLKSNDFLEAWTRADLPARYGYNNPTRTGDAVVSLKRGYSFTSQRMAATRPASPGPTGMHGYDANQNPDMLGFAVIWRYRHKFGGEDLGRVDSLSLHPTVARILGISPALNAKVPPIVLKN